MVSFSICVRVSSYLLVILVDYIVSASVFFFFNTVTAKDTEVMIIVQVLKFQASVMV